MFLKSLTIQNLRCFEESYFEFCPDINLIYGLNAQGKTTLLEAVHLLMTGRSFRAPHLKDLIRTHSQNFYIAATFVKHQIEQCLTFAYDGQTKQIMHNSTSIQQNASLLGILPGVTLAPDDANLIKGGPAGRRHFLDLQIAQIDPLYVHHLTRYLRAIKQRNTLLKNKTNSTIETWEAELANAGAYLIHQRYRLSIDLQQSIGKLESIVNIPEERLEVAYKSTAPFTSQAEIRTFLLEQYKRLRNREIAIGTTLVGPHRDDLQITIRQKEARFFASEGQQRSCIITLRLAEWKSLRQQSIDAPLMLLDDVTMSLDSTRRIRLLDYLQQLGQVFLTSTDQVEWTQNSKHFQSIYIRL